MPRTVTRLFAALASVAALAAVPAPASAGVTEFSAGLTLANAPTDITAGPDGNLWFTEQGILPAIGRITPTGAITEYPVALLQVPGEITAGDDALWFTERGLTNRISRIDPATGSITSHALPAGSRPTGIAAGSDGNLWFTQPGKVGRITPAGVHAELGNGLAGSDTLNDITAGPDGKLWFTVEQAGQHRIGRIDPANPGNPSFYSYGLTGAPNQIVAASDGKLYFTITGDPAAIGRIKTDGSIKEYRTGLTADSRPTGIAEGGDGALWFTGGANPGRLGRLWPDSHAITEYAGGIDLLDLTPNAGPAGITRGPDGNVWFTESGLDGRIGRMTVRPRAHLALKQIEQREARHDVTTGQLEAKIAANSQPTTYYVEYGRDWSFDMRTAVLPAGSGAEPDTRVVDLELEASSHYQARLVATNGSGESVSDSVSLWVNAAGDLSDFEPPVPSVPSIPTDPTPLPTVGTPVLGGGGAGDPVSEPAPAAGDAPIAPPVLGEAVIVRPLSGSVRVKRPGASAYTTLAGGMHLPVGTLVDARRGRITLQSARNARGRTQTGTFWGAVFEIRQRRRSRGVTDLVLRGGRFSSCATRAGASGLAHAAGNRRRVVRRLWGKDKHARFRTHGRDSVATVRGTRWVTTDRCDGTLTRVTEGKVLVRDLHRKRNVLLTAGRAYLARHRR